MGQRIILSENEKLNIQKMYGLINEQNSTNNIGMIGPGEPNKLGLNKDTNNEKLNVLYTELKDYLSKEVKSRHLLRALFIQNDEKIVLINLKDGTRKSYKISEVFKNNGQWSVKLGNEIVPISEFFY